ncbi:MAG: phytanoyl-CoA dioxygenase family protein [Pseudomonadota bacterium]|nr:phytanoyl-CoA dioxygenase family protein [Pseudomonadota bacterium]
MSEPRFSEADIQHYRDHGYVLLNNFLTPSELDSAYEELERIIPGWVSYTIDANAPKPRDWNEPPASRRNMRFPFAGDRLNEITLHPELRRFAATIAGHDELFCEQSDLTYKCKGHVSDTEQLMHMDFGNHTLVYPSSEPRFWQTTYLLYYTEVTENHAPTAVCSWQNYKDEVHWPSVHSRDERPDLYTKEIKATVSAGSVLAYSMRTYHRGTAFKADGGRIGQFISYAPRHCPWLGIVGWPEQGVRKAYHRWIEQSTIEERELIGFPPPGHPYWTEEMLIGVQARFPELDLSPYQSVP